MTKRAHAIVARKAAEKPASPLVKRTLNGMLALFSERLAVHQRIPSEAELAAMLGVSRSPVREAARILTDSGLLRRDGSATVLDRAPARADRVEVARGPASKSEAFDAFFLRKLHRRELAPGDRFSELELARAAGLNTVTVREGLLRFARSGLIHKQPRRQWAVVAFDEAMIDELFDLRELLEMAALAKALALPDDHAVLVELRRVLDDHRRFARSPDKRVGEFLALDERFHGALFKAAANRYLDEMFSTVSLLIHFQLQHDRVGERGMGLGLDAHPPVIEAILARDGARARRLHLEHLASARMIMKLAAGVTPRGHPATIGARAP